MTEAELWKAYSAKNPSFDGDSNITMSAAGLRKLFKQTWDTAHEQGVRNGRALEKLEAKTADLETAAERLMKKFTKFP